MAASQAHERNRPKKGPWSPEEDRKLIACINKLNESGVRLRWEKVPELARLNRNWKSCNGRWKQYLRPDIKRGNLSPDEIQTIIGLHAVLGNKWANIARQLGRSDSKIKNYWNGRLKKKIGKKDIPPQPLPYAAVFSANQNYPRRYAPRLHPDVGLPSPHLHGVDFISTDPVGALHGLDNHHPVGALHDLDNHHPLGALHGLDNHHPAGALHGLDNHHPVGALDDLDNHHPLGALHGLDNHHLAGALHGLDNHHPVGALHGLDNHHPAGALDDLDNHHPLGALHGLDNHHPAGALHGLDNHHPVGALDDLDNHHTLGALHGLDNHHPAGALHGLDNHHPVGALHGLDNHPYHFGPRIITPQAEEISPLEAWLEDYDPFCTEIALF